MPTHTQGGKRAPLLKGMYQIICGAGASAMGGWRPEPQGRWCRRWQVLTLGLVWKAVSLGLRVD